MRFFILILIIVGLCLTISVASGKGDPFLSNYLRMRQVMNNGDALTLEDKQLYPQLHDRFQEDRLDNQGGPDEYGYTFMDNQGGDTATYSWVELRGDASAHWITFAGDHDESVEDSVPIGFSFPFYGSSYVRFMISTNGVIQFNSYATYPFNECLPNDEITGPAIFPFWDDLHLDNGGNGVNSNLTVAYRSFGTSFVIEFDSIGHFGSTASSYKFEVILYQTGRIKLQYNNMVYGNYPGSQTIGIQSNSGSALQYACDILGTQPMNGSAVWILPPPVGSITGIVTSTTGATISVVRVEAISQHIFTSTNSIGRYTLNGVRTGPQDIVASKYGYYPDTLTGILVAQGDITTANITLDSMALTVFPSTNVPLSIPDVDTVFSTLTIVDSSTILDLNVVVTATHSWDSDLWIGLISPWADTVALSNHRGGDQDNYNGTIFDDECGTSIANGSAPFTGQFRPESPLSALYFHRLDGTWRLMVIDNASGDTGILVGWALHAVRRDTLGGSIHGVVTIGSNGLPAPGITVTTLTTPPFTQTTNEQGEYNFDGIPVGTISMEFRGGLFTTKRIDNIPVTAGSDTVLNAIMFVSIVGTVTSSGTLDPLAGVHLRLNEPDMTTTTDFFGSYALGGCGVGNYTLTVNAPLHHDTVVANVAVQDDRSNLLNIALNTDYLFYTSADTLLAIHDLDTTVSQITVPDHFSIENLAVVVHRINHNWDSDLDIYLRSPDNVTVLLSADNGGSGSNYIFTVFRDSADQSIVGNSPPFTGEYRPEQPLNALVGHRAEGTWSLLICDDQPSMEGSFNQWDLAFFGHLSPFGVLAGEVRDTVSNQPISAAVISIPAAGLQTTSNADGIFVIDSVPPGTWSVTCDRPTYCRTNLTNVTFIAGDTTTRTINLRRKLIAAAEDSLAYAFTSGTIVNASLMLRNPGTCSPVHFAITDTSAWLSTHPDTGTIPAGDSTEITITMDATQLGLTRYHTALVISHTAFGSTLIIPVQVDILDAATDPASGLPREFALHGNYPNPFNSSTEIHYDLPKSARVTLSVYNMLGQEVGVLVSGTIAAGRHRVLFNANGLTSGLYFVRMHTEGKLFTSKLMLLR